jgi:imidazolonepropionase-like amidohydrolase
MPPEVHHPRGGRAVFYVGGIFDPSRAEVSGPCSITVDDGRIVAISKSARDAGASTQHDFSDCIAMPGLIDPHTHLTLSTPGDERTQVGRPPEERSLRALGYMQTMLAEGVTTIRSMGEPAFLDVRFRDAFRQGLLRGPRIVASGRMLGPTHADVALVDAPADGPELLVRIRENLAERPDWIKLYATPSSVPLYDNPCSSYFSREEVDLVVATARRAGRPVAAHAHGGEAVDFCIAAGVRTIEHGRYLTDAQLEQMARHGTTLCATAGIVCFDTAEHESCTPDQALERTTHSIGRALEAGVNVVAGTDAVHGQLGFEIRALEFFGMTRLEAIRAVTTRSAELLGVAEEVGRIKEGFAADLALMPSGPLDGERLPRPRATIVAGRVAWHADNPVGALA